MSHKISRPVLQCLVKKLKNPLDLQFYLFLFLTRHHKISLSNRAFLPVDRSKLKFIFVSMIIEMNIDKEFYVKSVNV